MMMVIRFQFGSCHYPFFAPIDSFVQFLLIMHVLRHSYTMRMHSIKLFVHPYFRNNIIRSKKLTFRIFWFQYNSHRDEKKIEEFASAKQSCICIRGGDSLRHVSILSNGFPVRHLAALPLADFQPTVTTAMCLSSSSTIPRKNGGALSALAPEPPLAVSLAQSAIRSHELAQKFDRRTRVHPTRDGLCQQDIA
jgi:hypothetical protein